MQIKNLTLLVPARLVFSCTLLSLSLGLSQTAAFGSTFPSTANHSRLVRSELEQVGVQVPSLPALGDAEEHIPEMVTYLVLKLGQRRVYVYQGSEVLASYPVAIGRADTPTPVGEFEVFQMIENPSWQSPWTGEVHEPGADSPLGLRWIGFAPMSNGIIGFHGTPTLSSIGQAASNGCVRMRNEDVTALFRQVEVGTLVVVEP
jgi:lipoprotein-anchoring transpeptidase ErfK/SrfK